jgi:hypothetical protein
MVNPMLSIKPSANAVKVKIRSSGNIIKTPNIRIPGPNQADILEIPPQYAHINRPPRNNHIQQIGIGTSL